MKTKTLVQLDRERRDAEKALNDAIEERFEDEFVYVRWGEHEVAAYVIATTNWGRVKVRSRDSGKEYWVDAQRLVEFGSW